MVTLESTLNIASILSLVVVLAYYSLQIRNQNRTRQIQIIMQLSQQRNEETSIRNLELVNMQWDDYDDFEKKYGSDHNPANFSKRSSSWYQYNTIGLLLKKGMIDPDTLFGIQSGETALFQWTKFGTIIKEIRKRYNMPRFCVNFEYLATENVKYLQQKGFSAEIPDAYYTYIPKE